MKKIAYSGLAFLVPVIAFAQTYNNVQDLAAFAINLINNVAVPLIFALAFLVFIWGVFQYFIAGAGNEEKRDTGKQFMLYGIIGFFVMISVWGLVRILTGTVRLNNTSPSGALLPQADNTGNVR
ncbi:MAG: hypothetical protein ABIT47_01235 [Candidatus Paceibacterota bacterium]